MDPHKASFDFFKGRARFPTFLKKCQNDSFGYPDPKQINCVLPFRHCALSVRFRSRSTNGPSHQTLNARPAAHDACEGDLAATSPSNQPWRILCTVQALA
ncbi:hypothetical protein [Bradyrhizobium sp. 31Argb]|uniref:hypothetical protein n=1 Tax=Bradyrhizobium sp. 31Argb TaxID=3141247 RepID=UPI00102E4B52